MKEFIHLTDKNVVLARLKRAGSIFLLAVKRVASLAISFGFLLLIAVPVATAQGVGRGSVGDTELHWAAYRGHASVVQRLLRQGASINQPVEKGSTPLHLAAYKGHEQVVALLIENGANVNARTQDGITALDWARSNQHSKVEQRLLAAGAKVGKPLPVNRPGVAAVAPSPGRYLLSNSGEYHARPTRTNRPETRLQDEVIERPIRQEELDRLASVTQMKEIMARHREQPPEPVVEPEAKSNAEPPAPEPPATGNTATEPARTPVTENTAAQADQPPMFRVQLAAVGESERAQQVRAEFSASYREVLGKSTLVVEPVSANGRQLYRVRSTGMSERDATGICEQLRIRGQDCILVAP